MSTERAKITVLHLCEHFGGVNASLHGVARAFQWWIPSFDTDRFHILLCSRKGKDKAAEQMERAGLRPLTLGYGKMDPRNLVRLLRIVRRKEVDIIHAHGFGACLWARLAGHIKKVPVIVHGRCNYGTVPLLMRPVERVLGPRTRYAFAVSESTRQYTISKRHIPADAVDVLYNGILLDRIPKVTPDWIGTFRSEQGVGLEDRVVGVVGRVVSHKGHLDLFRAAERLAPSLPGLRIWVLGDGDYQPILERWVREHDFAQHVRFFGFRRDVLEIIQSFDVQVFPSHYEGTPNTLFEALAVGNCMVACPSDGQGEILEDGVTALLYPTGDSVALADRLRRVLTDEALASHLRRNAFARRTDFDGMACVHTMETLYTAIMEGQA